MKKIYILLIFSLLFTSASYAFAQTYTTTSTNTSTSGTSLTQDQINTFETEIAQISAAIQSLITEITQLKASGQLSQLSGGCYTYNTDLNFGSTGPDVTALQNFLITRGYLKIPTATGYFGSLTKTALEAWQVNTNLSSTSYGYVDAATRALLNTPCTTTVATTTPTTTPVTITTAPQITAISPGSGNAGDTITLTGSGFMPTGNTVNFGTNTTISNVSSSNNGTTLTFTVPNQTTPCATMNVSVCTFMPANVSPGTYLINVTTPAGTSGNTSFTVNNNTIGVTSSSTSGTSTTTTATSSTTPTIVGLSQTAANAGVLITITGTNFASSTNSVNIGATTIPNIASTNNGTTLQFVVPNMAVGSYPVTISNANGVSSGQTFTITQ